jgi:hypothetical protein
MIEAHILTILVHYTGAGHFFFRRARWKGVKTRFTEGIKHAFLPRTSLSARFAWALQ